jgi:hypothetical protein
MGANAQTTVPSFTAQQILTAAQMNDSARTGVPVFATTTTRDAAFGGAGEKTLAEGQLCYLESTDVVQYYNGSTWATVGPIPTPGLTLITALTTFGPVASVSLANDTFTSTYENYRIMLNTDAASASTLTVRWRAAGVDASTGPYYWAQTQSRFNATSSVYGGNNVTSMQLGIALGNIASFAIDVMNPKAVKRSKIIFNGVGWEPSGGAGTTGNIVGMGYRDSDTSYDSLTILGTTNFSGSYTVYGYN